MLRKHTCLALRPRLLFTALSLACSATALAQSTDPEATASPDVKSLDTVSVSASRIDSAGFVAPTPTTVIGAVELEQGARLNVAAVLNDLPMFKASASPQTSTTMTTNGSAPVDLRGLGATRTLVLLNGRRFVGNGDLNSIPFALVKSVDIVTGGASAAWGSDAVAGVVNVVLDDKLEGFTVQGSTGVSSRDDNAQYQVSAAGGTNFADGRGHVVFGGEFLDNDGIFPKTARNNIGRWALTANPTYSPTNGQGLYRLSPNVVMAGVTRGGHVNSGVLAGQTFNPDGTLRPYQAGADGVSYDDVTAAITPQKRYAFYTKATFDLTDDVRLSADFRYTNMYNHYNWFTDSNNGQALRISAENAFLSQAVRDRLASAGETSFTLGRFNADLAQLGVDFSRRTRQATVALDGVFGDYWRWDTYVSHGEAVNNSAYENFRLTRNFALSVDSLLHPVTGQPICRIALTDPQTNCVPINLFGEGSPTQAARDYVTGTSYSTVKTTLDTAGASLRGEPFSSWAGPVSIATGLEVRREKMEAVVDARAAAKEFVLFNPAPLSGSYTVKEAFLEALVPLAKDLPFLRDFNFNGAARISDYSTSGSIWSWKLGLTNQLTDDLRLRYSKSRDIRSANLVELYTTSTTLYTQIADPVTGVVEQTLSNGGGNPDLIPETSDTTTLGLIYEPGFVPGLTVSLDYFDIDIRNIIAAIGGQDMVNRCHAGNTALCSYINRDPVTNRIINIRTPYVNLARYQTSGFDLDAMYNVDLSRINLPGKLRVRGIVTYVDELVTDDGVNRYDLATSVGGNGVPRWRTNVSLNYQNGGFGADLRARYISGGKFNVLLDIDNNAIGSYTYVDVGLNYDFGNRGSGFGLFGGVSNLLDKDPPIASSAAVFYDVVGRYYTLGARYRF